jgi:hypothetical protein
VTSTTVPPAVRQRSFQLVDSYGSIVTVGVYVTAVRVQFDVHVDAGTWPSCGIEEFRQAYPSGTNVWPIGASGNVIRITSPLGSCRCLNVTCVTGESWTQAFGPPWPIQHSIYFDPLQPFVIVWQGQALYVD